MVETLTMPKPIVVGIHACMRYALCVMRERHLVEMA